MLDPQRGPRPKPWPAPCCDRYRARRAPTDKPVVRDEVAVEEVPADERRDDGRASASVPELADHAQPTFLLDAERRSVEVFPGVCCTSFVVDVAPGEQGSGRGSSSSTATPAAGPSPGRPRGRDEPVDVGRQRSGPPAAAAEAGVPRSRPPGGRPWIRPPGRRSWPWRERGGGEPRQSQHGRCELRRPDRRHPSAVGPASARGPASVKPASDGEGVDSPWVCGNRPLRCKMETWSSITKTDGGSFQMTRSSRERVPRIPWGASNTTTSCRARSASRKSR